MEHLEYFVYWTLVFGIVSWFVHETWPIGLLMVPLGVLCVQLKRMERRRFGP